jgi:carboxyl-terminal processing protease
MPLHLLRKHVTLVGILSASLVALAPCPAAVVELEGVVKAIDATAGTITIERSTAKGSKTLELEVAKTAGDLSAMKVGQRVKFTYDPAIEIVTKLGGGAGNTEAGATPGRRAVLKPGPDDARIAKAVATLFEETHFLKPTIDDTVARRWFDAFLESLDPMKMYLTGPDVARLAGKRDRLDDMIRDGDTAFAYEALASFLERIDQRQPLIERLIGEDHDFTTKEWVVVDRGATKWAADDAEAEDMWRRRIKYDLLVQKMEKTPPGEATEKLLRRYRSFAKRMHQMTADEILESFLASLGASLDPQTTYMSPGTLENFEIGMKLELDGIGAQLKGEDGYTTIVELTPGGAAEKDGRLKPQDRILAIGQGKEGEMVDVVDMNLNDVVKLIRGKRGTVVRLKTLSPGSTTPRTQSITRSKIELRDAKVLGDVFTTGSKSDGKPFKIGVIQVPSLYMDASAAQKGSKDFKSCSRDVERLLEGFRLQNVDCVVLDMRNNGGGMVPEAIRLTGLFIDHGPVIQIRKADGTTQTLDDNERGVVWSGPLVVLVSQFTGSAAEIVAGAIQDYRRGIVVGDERTSGGGTIKTVLDVGKQTAPQDRPPPKLGAVKISIQQLCRPSGKSVQLDGVRSDVTLPSLTAVLPIGESALKNAMPAQRSEPASFKAAGDSDEAVVRKVQSASQKRVATKPEFKAAQQAIAHYNDARSRDVVSLVEQDFAKAWRKGEAAESAEMSAATRERGSIPRDFYLDEVLDIAADYSAALAR